MSARTTTTRRGLRLAAGVALVTGTLLVTAPAAQAIPSGCSAVQSGRTATARCTSGTGEVRAVIGCGRFRPVDFDWVQYGPWKPVGTTSSVTCSSNAQYADGAFYETR